MRVCKLFCTDTHNCKHEKLLDRWVGGSEKLVREVSVFASVLWYCSDSSSALMIESVQLFADAEAELASVNGDARRSALHVIVIDEIDAVFRKRSSAEDSGEATR